MKPQRIFIPCNVPSSKNSKVATTRGVFHSKTVRKYLQQIGVKHYGKNGVIEYKTRSNLFKIAVGNSFKDIEYPLWLGFHFVRDTKRKFDFINACQIICDLLVAHKFIEDDNMACLLPYPLMINGQAYSVDKNHAGVYLQKGKQ